MHLSHQKKKKRQGSRERSLQENLVVPVRNNGCLKAPGEKGYRGRHCRELNHRTL